MKIPKEVKEARIALWRGTKKFKKALIESQAAAKKLDTARAEMEQLHIDVYNAEVAAGAVFVNGNAMFPVEKGAK